MDQKPPATPEEPEVSESLDAPSTVVANNSADNANAAQETGVISAENANAAAVGKGPRGSFSKRFINRLLGFNIYLLLFVFVIIVAGVVVLFSYNYSKKKSGTAGVVTTTTLSQDTLDQLASSDATVGASGQVLNVQSSAVFAGKILARSDLEVAGNLQLGGSLSLPNITVTDAATLGQVNISKNLSVAGNSAVQGQQTIGSSLQVGGGASFGGNISAPQVATSNLQLNGDLVLTHHITAGGGTPGRSNGTAVGNGGTATVGGSDTAGSVSINTGSDPNAGCFITVNFTAKYNATPHVLVTPVGSAAGGINYYVNRTTSNFSICSSNTPPAGASFGFDYFVVG